jgi:glycosyltransferase involved in cell wall biosynthesis
MIKTKQERLLITVVEPRSSGGMIHYAYQLCTALAEEGAEVTLVTSLGYELENYPHNFTVKKILRLWSPTDSFRTMNKQNWIEKVLGKLFWSIRRIIRGGRYIIEWIRLVKYLLKTRPTITQFGKIEFPFEAVFLAILKRNGLILTQICHEFELREKDSNIFVKIANQLFQWVYTSFQIIFFHGQNNQDRFSSLFKIDSNKFHQIPHGNEHLFLSSASRNLTSAQMRERYKIGSNSPVVLFFGNLMPSKGIPDLLKAFAQVLEKEKQTRLIIAGKPSKHIDMDSIFNLTSSLNIEQATVFDSRYIPIEEVAPLMEMASVVVYPYLNSTQSGSLQVAYAFSRPVIATSVGGLPEEVDDGKSGFLVPPESPHEIANAIMKYIENPTLTYEMGLYAKHLSETRYSWNSIAQEVLTVYKDTVNVQNK